MTAPYAGSVALRAEAGLPLPGADEIKFQAEGVSAWFGAKQVLHGVDLAIPRGGVTAIIGPSGCGKSTFIRCLNRMHELVRTARVEGRILLDGADVYAPTVDPVLLRRRVGMVFQRPNPFPFLSIRDNVLAGLRFTGALDRSRIDQVLEESLGAAALWEEVRDRLDEPGGGLSGGQQQRLCIARALAVAPEVLLMDEPCSALDPVATARIEDLIHSLRDRYTVVIVTHNMQQAARVSDRTAFFLMGELVELAETRRLFTSPADRRTEDYISGRFG